MTAHDRSDASPEIRLLCVAITQAAARSRSTRAFAAMAAANEEATERIAASRRRPEQAKSKHHSRWHDDSLAQMLIAMHCEQRNRRSGGASAMIALSSPERAASPKGLVEQADGPADRDKGANRELPFVAPPFVGGAAVFSRTRACRRVQHGCAPQTAHHHSEKTNIVLRHHALA